MAERGPSAGRPRESGGEGFGGCRSWEMLTAVSAGQTRPGGQQHGSPVFGAALGTLARASDPLAVAGRAARAGKTTFPGVNGSAPK